LGKGIFINLDMIFYFIVCPLIGIVLSQVVYDLYRKAFLEKDFDYRNFQRLDLKTNEWISTKPKYLWLKSIFRLQFIIAIAVFAFFGSAFTVIIYGIVQVTLDIFDVNSDLALKDQYVQYLFLFYGYSSLIVMLLSTSNHFKSFDEKLLKDED
jgi:hypothetical protein